MIESEKITFTKSGGESEENIRCFLNRNGVSTSLIAKAKFGGIYLNGINVTMRATVRPSDTVTVYLPKESSPNIPPIPFDLDIIYEDECVLAVNKPRNMPVHPSKGNNLPTLANGVMAYYGENFVFRAVNRLDRDTSGIVVIAKDRYCSALLSSYIKERRVEKKYVALVEGVPSPSSGVIELPIEREREGSMKRIVRPDGKESITEYKLLCDRADGTSVCEVSPITGRTHQIRVHMAHIGHPLFNDFLYGTRTDENDTYRLHCFKLSIPHPRNGKTLDLNCPADFI